MWVLITIFVTSVGSPVQLNQIGPAENDLSSCEARLSNFLSGPESVMARDDQGLYVVTDYGYNSTQFRCFRVYG